MRAATKIRKRSLQANFEVQGTEPLYKQVERQILQCLASGEWKPGDQLPTEKQLAERFGVAVFTIRAGIGELVAARILLRRQGKGTFVARHNRQRQRYQYSHVYSKAGLQVTAERKLLLFGRDTASSDVAQALGIPPGDQARIYRIVCLLTVDAKPVATLDIAVPITKFGGLTAKAIRESKENLYAVYQDVCGINVIRIDEKIHAARAKSSVARALKIAVDSPVLLVERIAYTYNDTPVEYRIRHFPGDSYYYRTSEGGA